MTAVSMFDAKTNLSKYVNSVSSGQESYIVILKSGTPVAKIVPYEDNTRSRIGLAEGVIPYLVDDDEFNRISVEDDFFGNGRI